MSFSPNNPKKQASSEKLGAFGGYVRRPDPNTFGMIAQFFGENGEAADTILALSLSKFQDVEVLVDVYWIKDASGALMKKEDETYPLICSFRGFVRRSVPRKDGMIAQFFAPNGEYADSVAELSKSHFQDSLVFVDVRGAAASQHESGAKFAKEAAQEIEESHAKTLSKTEKDEYRKKEKAFKKMNALLAKSDFYKQVEVAQAAGTAEEFKSWIDKYAVCSNMQDGQCMNPCGAIEVSSNILPAPFNYLCSCEKHKANMQNEEHLAENRMFYEIKHGLMLEAWLKSKFVEMFSIDGKGEPDSNKIIDWCMENKLGKYLPSGFKVIP